MRILVNKMKESRAILDPKDFQDVVNEELEAIRRKYGSNKEALFERAK